MKLNYLQRSEIKQKLWLKNVKLGAGLLYKAKDLVRTRLLPHLQAFQTHRMLLSFLTTIISQEEGDLHQFK